MKRTTRILGVLLALAAGGYFVFYAHRALAGQDLRMLLAPRVLLAGAALTALYALLIPFTGLAWTWLLRGLGQTNRVVVTLPILAVTQFGKYLPGNVAQHLGRIALARAKGMRLASVIASLAYETLLVLVACAHVSALTLLWSPPVALAQWPLAHYRLPLIAAVTVGAVMLMLAAPRLAEVFARRRAMAGGISDYTPPSLHPGWQTAASCYALYVLNFVLVGIGLWLAARALVPAGTQAPNLVFLTGAFASSWILGFLAPGAPAGLGVREALLSVWIGGTLAPSDTVALILLLRIATTLGDLVNFGWGTLAMRR